LRKRETRRARGREREKKGRDLEKIRGEILADSGYLPAF